MSVRIALQAAWTAAVAAVYFALANHVLHGGAETAGAVVLSGALAPLPLGMLGSFTTRISDNWVTRLRLAGVAAGVVAVVVFGIEMQADPTGCGVSSGDCDTAYGLGVSVLFAVAFLEFLLGIALGWLSTKVLRGFVVRPQG